ncbi:MAG: hypothetical protein ACYC9S_13870 [Leptospirales bacterium]
MAGFYFKGVDLSSTDEKDLPSIRRRVGAHGSSCHADRIQSSQDISKDHRYWQFYSSLYQDAVNLLKLLDEANKEMERLSVSHSPGPAVKVNLSLDGQKINRAIQAFNEVMGE